MPLELSTFWPSSWIDFDSSSAAAATVSTLALATLTAPEASVESWLVLLATSFISLAMPSSWVAAEETVFSTAVICSSKPRISRSEEHTSELQSLMHISYAVFCLKKHTTHEDKTVNRID